MLNSGGRPGFLAYAAKLQLRDSAGLYCRIDSSTGFAVSSRAFRGSGNLN